MERHFSTLYRFFRSKVDHDVEDLTQRTFMLSLEGLDRLRRDRDFRAYLLGIARRLLLRRFRDQAIVERNTDPMRISAEELALSPSRAVAIRDERKLLSLGLRRIPIDLQICLELHYWEGMAVADIGEVLGVAPGTVKSRLHRAREQLRKRFEAMETDPALVSSTMGELSRWANAVKQRIDRQHAAAEPDTATDAPTDDE
ncbi:MAG: sigma-70 family RNA polymerase sigma factor [Myxococcota bacterium]